MMKGFYKRFGKLEIEIEIILILKIKMGREGRGQSVPKLGY